MEKQWYIKTLEYCDAQWHRNIIDGTESGNKAIGMTIFPAAGLHPMPGYENGDFSWCGVFGQAAWLAGGILKRWLNNISAGKTIFGFAQYNMYHGAKAFSVYPAGPELKARHLSANAPRVCKLLRLATTSDIKPGYLLVRSAKDRPFNGHIMVIEDGTIVGNNATIFTYEGNATGRGPTGSIIEGVVRKERKYKMDGMYDEHYIIGPSYLDFLEE